MDKKIIILWTLILVGMLGFTLWIGRVQNYSTLIKEYPSPTVSPNYPNKEFYKQKKQEDLENQKEIDTRRSVWETFCGKDNVNENWNYGTPTFSCDDNSKIPDKSLN